MQDPEGDSWATEQLFAKRGIEATTMREITAKAGTNLVVQHPADWRHHARCNARRLERTSRNRLEEKCPGRERRRFAASSSSAGCSIMSSRANGIDWDQPRTIYLSAPLGLEAQSDFVAIRAAGEEIRRLLACVPGAGPPPRRRAPRKRLKPAITSPRARTILMAAVHWGAAQWPFDENNEENLFCNKRKRECYTAYAKLAAHQDRGSVDSVQGLEAAGVAASAAGLQRRQNAAGRHDSRHGQFQGNQRRDVWRPLAVARHGGARGRWAGTIRERGARHSGLDRELGGGGRGDHGLDRASVRRSTARRSRFPATASARSSARSMVANEPRFKACVVSSPNLEPGCHTIFEEASPTFKQRFMYMAQISDEAEFDEFRQTLSCKGHAEKIKLPYLCVGGESDELCPIKHVDDMLATMKCPQQFVVYQDSRHAIGGVPAATLGPFLPSLISDWVAARIADKPFASEKWFIDATGNVTKTPLK